MGIECSPARVKDAAGASKMIQAVFAEFVAPGFAPEGVKTFLDFASGSAIAYRLSGQGFGFVAKDGDRVVGYIEIRSNDHICLMFVDRSYHRRGICRNLLELAAAECVKRDAHKTEITVHSSPFAVEAYQRLGFNQTAPEQKQDGIRFVPMRYSMDVKKE
ncbi:MAG: GNAT family N-acetyltransferase [Myxococcota bacterium]|nr:GNAT family N-acetyltransferase [Myxococcota bacterium]